MNNEFRANRAKRALMKSTYSEETEDEGLETVISDMMVDLLHLWNQECKEKTLTLESLFLRLELNFEAELEDEEG